MYDKRTKKEFRRSFSPYFYPWKSSPLGFSHKENIQAKRMEEIEKSILIKLGIEDPYQ